MTTKQFLAQLKAINDASDQSYDFIKTCYYKGLCTYKEAKRAIKSVHDQTMKDIVAVADASDNEYQFVEYN